MSKSSILNWLINNLPVELHLPGYNYCGPGTKSLEKRAVNRLDEFCKEHDIAYQQSSDLSDRRKADIKLMKMARNRITASDASLGEKVAAHIVNKAMLAKIKYGAGLRTKNKLRSKKISSGSGIKKQLKHIISHTKKHLKKIKPKGKTMAIKLAMKVAKELATNSSVSIPRIIPVPKTGGFLPLIPIFAGLSAIGSLAGGAAGIAKAINDYKAAEKRLNELKRHNEKIESLSIGKGLNIKPFKEGFGISIADKKNVMPGYPIEPSLI